MYARRRLPSLILHDAKGYMHAILELSARRTIATCSFRFKNSHLELTVGEAGTDVALFLTQTEGSRLTLKSELV